MQNDDLISRSVLLQKIKEEYDLNYGEILINPERFYYMVEDMPTAYDVEKVLAELEEKFNEPAYQHNGEDFYTGICVAETIVRNGGKE